MGNSNNQIEGQLFAARKEAFQQAGTTNLFKTLLFIVVIIGGIGLAAYYTNKQGLGQSVVRAPFDEKEVRHKIIELEKDIAILKSDLALVKKPNPVIHAAQSILEFAIANWVLLSFLVALLTALYVKYQFKIDYFESYRDLATKKMLSEFYQHLGDRMMTSSEWDAAETAYRDSLAINPTNIKATYGIAKVSVFQPLKGQTFFAPDIADVKLDYLIANPPQNANAEDLRRDFAQLYFLKAINRSNLGDDAKTKTWLEKAIESDPTFVGPLLNLGYLYESAGEIDKAIECYQKAIGLDPNWALANHNLGSVYLITAQFDQAIQYLECANKISPFLLTDLSLGEAYAYAGKLDLALTWHDTALSSLAIPGIEKERYIVSGGTWLYSFMPLQKGDKETIKRSVRISTFEQKKMLTHYTVALDYALLGDIRRADEKFAQARAFEKAADYSGVFLNRIQSMLNLVNMAPAARAWFEAKTKELSLPAKPPAPSPAAGGS